MLTLLILFFIPTIIAIARNANPLGVFLLNFFLGWTIVFWWVALIWSLIGRVQVRTVYVHA
jgi:T4 superinfection immunity protein